MKWMTSSTFWILCCPCSWVFRYFFFPFFHPFVSLHVDSSGAFFFGLRSRRNDCACVLVLFFLFFFKDRFILFKLVEKLSTINFMLRNNVARVCEKYVWLGSRALTTWEREWLPEKWFAGQNARPIDRFRQEQKKGEKNVATKLFGGRSNVECWHKDRVKNLSVAQSGQQMPHNAYTFIHSFDQMHSFALWSV